MGQLGFFDLENRFAAISQCGDPLEKLEASIEWQIFQPILDKAFAKERKSNAGRPPYNYLMMFKVLILQRLNNISDEQMEFLLKDRLSYSRFIGLRLEDRVPDQKTIWLYRELLTKAGALEKLFTRFDRYLTEHGFAAKKGQIVDASIVEVPKQRNTREENDQVKAGETPEDWKDTPAQLCQKDTDARWTEKHGKKYYGYKNHISIDVKGKLIRDYRVTPANVHDSQVFAEILDPYNTNQTVWADSAYRSAESAETLAELQMRNQIHEKACRNRPLSKHQEKMNRKKSTIRARVEHIFGFMVNTMHGKVIRGIGLQRAAFKIGLMNLVYNLSRYRYLTGRIQPAMDGGG